MHTFHRFTLTAGITFLALVTMAGVAFTHSPGPDVLKACYYEQFYNGPDDNDVGIYWDYSVAPTGAHYINWCEAKDTLPNNWDDPGSSVDPCKSPRHYPGEFGKTVYLRVGSTDWGGGWSEFNMAPARYVFIVTINYPSTTPHHDNGNHVGMLLADLRSPSATFAACR